MSAWLKASVRALSEGLRTGACSSVELTRAHLEAIAARNPELNCYWYVAAESALAEAAASDARRARGQALHPLDGVPIGVKDNLAVAGMPWTAGMATRRTLVATEDAFCIAKLRRAGAVILGKQSLNEGALGADNDNPHFGPTQHPHCVGHTPGGSSGGSAAACAAGLAPASIGSDSMGSVRIPASYCGIAGFKPSYGRLSQRGLLTVSRRLDHVGVLARQVADLALVFQALGGYDPLDPAARHVSMRHAPTWGPGLRWAALPTTGVVLQPAVAAAFERALGVLERELGPPSPLRWTAPDLGRARRAGLLLCEAEMLHVHAADWAEQRQAFSPALRRLLEHAAGKAAADYVVAERRLDALGVELRRALGDVELIVTPTTPQVAFRFGEPVPNDQADLTCLANFAGVPALSLPIGADSAGRPIGLQLLGPIGSDLLLLDLGARMEVWFGNAEEG